MQPATDLNCCYRRVQAPVAISHIPPAFSQSVGVVYLAKSSEGAGGLADGEPGESVGFDPTGAVAGEPGAPVVSLLEGFPPPAPAAGLSGLVLPGAPLLTCAKVDDGPIAATAIVITATASWRM
jgi:hypothetical protein